MARQVGSRRWVRTLAIVALIAWLAVCAAGAAAAVAELVVASESQMEPAIRALSIISQAVGLLATIAGGLAGIVAYGLICSFLDSVGHNAVTAARIERVETLLESQESNSRKLIDLAQLSERAKGLLYRDRELEAFREVIHSDLMQQDYDSAQRHVDMIEQNGYAAEAQRLREDIESSRTAGSEEKVDAAIARIQEIVNRHDWARAHREASRLLQVFPDRQKVVELPRRIEQARSRHKRDLLQRYGEAVRKNAIDEGIALLRELDTYLTPQEAAALQDSARGVFRAKLHNLGVQFAICVTDQRWKEAIATGEQIMNDFPNSRMAHEVREKIDVLRSRAAETEGQGQ